jgi:hypothetical protein
MFSVWENEMFSMGGESSQGLKAESNERQNKRRQALNNTAFLEDIVSKRNRVPAHHGNCRLTPG